MRATQWKRFLGKSLRFSLLAAIGLALVVTIVITVWEWLENPGGIFRDSNGTRWRFVYDTAVSWFVPTLSQSFIVFFILYFLKSVLVPKKSPEKERNSAP